MTGYAIEPYKTTLSVHDGLDLKLKIGVIMQHSGVKKWSLFQLANNSSNDFRVAAAVIYLGIRPKAFLRVNISYSSCGNYRGGVRFFGNLTNNMPYFGRYVDT